MREALSNRELATIIWGVIFLVYVARTKSVRASILNVLRAFFVKKILVVIAIVASYIACSCLALRIYNLWSQELLKDSLLYIITASIYVGKVVSFDLSKVSNGFKEIIIENISIAIFITFIFNFYSLPLGLELLFIPIITIAAVMTAYIDSRGQEDDEKVKGCLKKLVFYINYSLLVYFILRTLSKPEELINSNTLKQILLPTLLTTMYLPALYLIAIYSVYEQSFVILKCMARGDDRECKFRRNILMRFCKLNLSKLIYVRTNWRPALPNTDEEFVREIEAVSNKKRISYYGE
ncbi:MAG: hypothetical protein SNH27_12770 [Rikenellaceae bacterium]